MNVGWMAVVANVLKGAFCSVRYDGNFCRGVSVLNYLKPSRIYLICPCNRK